MPALREMREDIPLIAQAILAKLCREAGRSACILKNDALAMLMDYDYPGNVRELENILERTLALCFDSEIGKDELQLPHKANMVQETSFTMTMHSSDLGVNLPLQDYLDRLEKDSIVKALNENRYNRTKAAKTLGITVRSLRYRMERLGLNEQV